MHHDYRVEKAKRFLEAAHLAYEHGQYENAVSRAYYAAYHLVAWVLMQHKNLDRRRWDHFQLLNAFLDNFCKPGFLFSVEDGNDLGELLDSRLMADYERTVFNERRAQRLITRADRLCGKLLGVGK